MLSKSVLPECQIKVSYKSVKNYVSSKQLINVSSKSVGEEVSSKNVPQEWVFSRMFYKSVKWGRHTKLSSMSVVKQECFTRMSSKSVTECQIRSLK